MASDFRHLLDLGPEDLLERLALVAAGIADCSAMLAQARGMELEDRSAGWHQSHEETVRGREKASQFNAVAAIQGKLEVEAQIRGLEAERDFIMVLIDVKTKVLARA